MCVRSGVFTGVLLLLSWTGGGIAIVKADNRHQKISSQRYYQTRALADAAPVAAARCQLFAIALP